MSLVRSHRILPRGSWPIRLLIALSLAVPAVTAQSPVPRYEVKRTGARPAIDGRLDEAAWAAAPVAVLQFLWESQTGPKQMTRARLLWDGEALYVGFDADDTDITAQFLNRGFVSRGFLEKMLQEHASGRRNNQTWLTTLLMLEMWFRAFSAPAHREACRPIVGSLGLSEIQEAAQSPESGMDLADESSRSSAKPACALGAPA